MLNPHQNKKLIKKLEACVSLFDSYIFKPVCSLPYKIFETSEHLRNEPSEELFSPPCEQWGGEGVTAWFKANYCPEDELCGKPLYIMPMVGGYEGMLWINGKASGTFATKIVVTRHGNHYCDLLCKRAESGKNINIAIEFYAGHYVKGCQPFETNIDTGFKYSCKDIFVCIKRQEVADFIYDLSILLQLSQLKSADDFRKAQVLNTLFEVHKVLLYSPENVSEDEWLASIVEARAVMRPTLEMKNGDSAPTAWLTGHSHMDTAWLWPVKETIRKNARTISNQLSLMEQFEEYRFIQSSSLHSAMMERYYPDIFSRMKEQIDSGKYEPNGAVWVECDCNLTGGEALVRQFLWGQRYTKEKFGYLADSFWLPDTFGYSAAIPQIMKGFGVKYFLTTKLAWNDTNTFPYESFVWEGIDKSKVLTHFFVMDTWTNPQELSQRIYGNGYADCLHNKQIDNNRLVAFGFGDGGGGPQFEMIELARRLENLEGCPKVKYTSVSKFMNMLEKKQSGLPLYKGELYLELHRGTLTGKQQIKKNNRQSEILLHNLEFLEVLKSVKTGKISSDEKYRSYWEILLKNQFHDILPGSCIPKAHDDAINELNEAITNLKILQYEAAKELLEDKTDVYSVCNTTGFLRNDVIYIKSDHEACDPAQMLQTQLVTLSCGSSVLAVCGVKQKGYSITSFMLKNGSCSKENQFINKGKALETPYYKVVFTDEGFIGSLVDKRLGRELCAGTALNTFLMAEDVPAGWDGWDIDADCFVKLSPCAELLSSEIVSSGAVEHRIRNTYIIGKASKIVQDMVFYANSPLICFETQLQWNEKHRFLKTAFDTTIQSSYATHEIQFGSIRRPTTRNNSFEQAMFEVCNHKYTDLSEPKSGVTLVNDCKYGISVEGGNIMLSLAKGGLRPDDRGDEGVYDFKYGFISHEGGYNAENSVAAAYSFNYESILLEGVADVPSLISVTSCNVIIETIKPCEDKQSAFIARLYECEGSFTKTMLDIPTGYRAIICDMLENEIEEISNNLTFEPFEIKTIKITYN